MLNRQLNQKDEYIENLRSKIRKCDEEKQSMCDTLSRIEANYKVAFRDQGVQDVKVKDLEEQLE